MDVDGSSAEEEQRAAAPADQPRLMIDKIVCTNFKSYAGVKELGPFHKVHFHLLQPK